ncbi:MAG: hypothetical protein H6662_00170 [Ardenticatenaceae bacterium]|nr:hypothetical protein [Anaerolineales bacterium]MCB8919970.1 hypothetical protein [Ardenticatenaceae bacterium]MCB8989817.1 hypothetical protein [Ardenticatenaceae bacterium]
MNARYYVSYIYRMVSADSIVPNFSNPQTLNRYAYALNSPLNFIDPTGHCSVDPYDDYADYDCLIEAQNLANEYGVSYDILAEFWELGASTSEELVAIWQAYTSSVPQLANPNPSAGDILAKPETVSELMSMMRIAPEVANISQALYDLTPSKSECHSVCAAATGQYYEEYIETANLYAKMFYELGVLGEKTLGNRTYAVYAFTLSLGDGDNLENDESGPTGAHSALMVSYDAVNPQNSIIVQVNGSVASSGVYFTRINKTSYFQRSDEGIYYVGIPR